MRKFFPIMALLMTLFMTASVKAEDACTTDITVHYHRFDNNYNNYELIVNNGSDESVIPIKQTDAFGALAVIPVCSEHVNELGVAIKNTVTGEYDGIDVNRDGTIDDKLIDITGGVSKDVFIIEGAAEPIYQNTNQTNYFGKPGYGNLVVIYYNTDGESGWNDFYTWDADMSESVPFTYSLGMNGTDDPDLFKAAVLNIAPDSDDQIGFVMRKNNSWIKDTAWAVGLTSDMTDADGNTYKMTGDILVNVSDIKGSGYKFLFVKNHNMKLFSDYEQFMTDTLKIHKAELTNPQTLSVTFSQPIAADAGLPDLTRFCLTDETGRVIMLSNLIRPTNASGAAYNMTLANKIDMNHQYVLTYSYNYGTSSGIVTAPVTFNESVNADIANAVDSGKAKVNYTPVVIGAAIVIVAAGTGIIVAVNRRH